MTPNYYAMLRDLVADRVYFGSAPQESAAPFVVWQLISSAPGLTLSGIPDHDRQIVQIDVYGANQETPRVLAFNVRDRLEAANLCVTDGPMQRGQEAETRLYRWQLVAEYIWGRNG